MILSVTSVRLAEAADLDLLQEAPVAAPGALLVVGQPVAGFARVVPNGVRLHLDELWVRPSHHGRGLDAMLLHAAFGRVLDAGFDRLTVSPATGDAQWYLRHGFQPTADERFERLIVDEPVPIPAVSVIPLREGASGLEAFVQHRVATMDFVPNAVVFPGGRIDPGDRPSGRRLKLSAGVVSAHVHAWQATAHDRLGEPEGAARTLLATGLREVAEETGAIIDPVRLIPWDDWETPIGYPKRFDVRFFVLPVETEEDASAFGHTTTEAHLSEWTPLADLCRGAEDGSLVLVPPTRVLVDELSRFSGLAQVTSARPPIQLVRHDLCPSPALRGRFPPTEPR